MPLLTSKNIWCPCLPHRLICNTFCCCFHLPSRALVNNSHFPLFLLFFFFPFLCCSHSLFLLLVVFLLPDRVSGKTTAMRWRCSVKIWSTVVRLNPPLHHHSLSSACSSWFRPGCCNTSEISHIPCVLPLKKRETGKKKKKTSAR